MITKNVPLHIAALKGDCESIQNYSTGQLESQITNQGETALHIAAAAKKLLFVERLINHLKVVSPFLEIENSSGNTALLYAAVSGDVKIAQVMLDAYANEAINTNDPYNPLATRGKVKPLLMAAMLGHCDMARYLIDRTKIEDWSGEDRVKLFTDCIRIGLCGEALKMLKAYPGLATVRNSDNETGLLVLAKNPSVLVPPSQPGWKTFIGLCEDSEKPGSEALDLVIALYLESISNPDLEEGDRGREIVRVIFNAAQKGNADLVIVLIRMDPDLVYMETQ